MPKRGQAMPTHHYAKHAQAMRAPLVAVVDTTRDAPIACWRAGAGCECRAVGRPTVGRPETPAPVSAMCGRSDCTRRGAGVMPLIPDDDRLTQTPEWRDPHHWPGFDPRCWECWHQGWTCPQGKAHEGEKE